MNSRITLLLALLLAATGCAAEATTSTEHTHEVAQASNASGGVAVGTAAATSAEPSDVHAVVATSSAAPTGGGDERANAGPGPDPWIGAGPGPDPWEPSGPPIRTAPVNAHAAE